MNRDPVRLGLALSLFFAFAPAPAWAFTNYSPATYAQATNDSVSSLINLVGIGADHHAYLGAAPLGLVGFDVGIDATYISLPSSFVSAISLVTNTPASSVPAGIPVPKLNLHKGLPGNVDLGFSFSTFPDSAGNRLFVAYGADVKWAFLRPLVYPTVAARASWSYNGLFFMRTHTYSLDLVASKTYFYLLEPYGGVGMQIWSGEVSLPAGVPAPPTGVQLNQSGVTPRFFGGLVFRVPGIRITAEADYSTASVFTLGGKLSFGI
jgi:hypothetical protein